MIGDSSLCDMYNLPVVSPCGNKVESDDLAFNFDLDKPELGFDDIFTDYIHPGMDVSISENFYSGLVQDKNDSHACNDTFEIFNDILADNDFNFNLLLTSDNNVNMKKEASIENFDNLPEPLESLPDEGWFSSPSNEHASSSSVESLQISPLSYIKDEPIDSDSGLKCVLGSPLIFPDTDVPPPVPVERPRIISTWKANKTSLNKRVVAGSVLRGHHLGPHNSNTAGQGRPFGSNTAPCYNEYGGNRSHLHKHRINRRHNIHRQFKPRSRDYSICPSESCPPVSTPIHRHGQTERERRAQENKRMRNIENAIRSITAFKSDAYFPRDRATKERTLKATKALMHFYHTSNVAIQNANLRLEIDEMKFRLSAARRLKQQQSTPFSGVNSNNPVISSSSTISRMTTHTLNNSSSAKFIHRHSSAGINKSIY